MSTATIAAPATTDEAEILTLIETMLKANHSKDAAAYAAPFAPDATVYNLAPSITASTSKKSRPGSTVGPLPSTSNPITSKSRSAAASPSATASFA
jgi:hypothetical protein